MRHVGSNAMALCLLLAGCVPSEHGPLLVSNPFGKTPEVQPYNAHYSPASKEAAFRAKCVGDKVVQANPEMGLRPLFLTIASPQPEIFHRGQKEIFVTEGLVKECVSEGQLAAVLCNELGKMAAEREALTVRDTRQPERRLGPDVPVGNDAGGVLGAADGIRRVEQAKFERERLPRDVTIPPPSADVLTRRYLEQAGYSRDDLDAAAPLLRQSEANGSWQKQIVGNGF